MTGSESKESNEEKTREVVFIVKDGKAVLRKLKQEFRIILISKLLEGIEPDDDIITSPYAAITKKLKDGDPVEIVEKEDLFAANKKKKKESTE